MTDTADTRPRQTGARRMPDGLGGHPRPGERIVWQGRPDQGFHIDIRQDPAGAVRLFFAGFAVFWMAKAAQAGGVVLDVRPDPFLGRPRHLLEVALRRHFCGAAAPGTR